MDSSPTAKQPELPPVDNDLVQQPVNDDLIRQLEQEIEESYDLKRRSSIETAALWNDLGNLCRDADKFEEAHVYFQKALELSRNQHPDEDDFEYYPSSSASVSSSNGEISRASSFGSHSSSHSGNLLLGMVSSDLSRDDQAKNWYQEALEKLRQQDTDNGQRKKHSKNKLRHLNIARTWNNLGTLYSKQGNREMARRYFDQALEKFYAVLGNENHQSRDFSKSNLPDDLKVPDVALALHNLGNLCFDVGQFGEAAVHLEAALQIHNHLAATRPNTNATAMAATLESLGELCVEMGRYAKAIEYYEWALTVQQQSKSRDDYNKDLERTAGTLGVLCFELGRFPQARTHFRTALDLQQQSSTASSKVRALTLDYLSYIEGKLGHEQLSRSYREQSRSLTQ